MFHSLRTNFAALAFSTVFVTAPVAAQELDVQVTRDEQTGLATYHATVQGQPNSQFFLMAALRTLPAPLPIGGFGWGLELDPTTMIAFPGPMPIDSQGIGQLSFSVPISLTEDLEIPFQALAFDATQASFSGLASAVQGFAPPGMSYEGAYTAGGTQYSIGFKALAPGDVVELKINGVVKGSGVVDANGKVKIVVRVKLRPGDVICVCVNGLIVKCWIWC